MFNAVVSKTTPSAASAPQRAKSIVSGAHPTFNAPQTVLTEVQSLGATNAEYFACDYITQHLQKLDSGAKVLVLSDGIESKNASNFAIDYPHLDIYSADYNFPPEPERVDCWGVGFTRIKIDNRYPLQKSIFGTPDIKFEAIMMIKGLCDHYAWHDEQGNDAGPVGCAAIRLDACGISSFLASLIPLLAKKGRFALHGDINFMDHQAQHQALSSQVQSGMIQGVNDFHTACVKPIAKVWTGDTGLVIAGENTIPDDNAAQASLNKLAKEHFFKKKLIACSKYPN